MTQFAVPFGEPIATLNFSRIVKIDISSFTGKEDYISVSLPELQVTKLTLSKCFIDFTSSPAGEFGEGPTDQIAFNEANPALPESNGDTEMRIPISLLKTIDKSNLTGVRFRIFAKEKCTFRCLSIRACSEHWLYAPIDFDTLWNRVHRPPAPNGKGSTPYTFPTVEESPKEWPITFRGNNLTSPSDPRPINASIGAVFTAGSFLNATGGTTSAFNEIALFFRDLPTAEQTQLDMDSFTQGQLDAKEGQPDFGLAEFKSRKQEELDLTKQQTLDGDTQFYLERLPDENDHSWIEVKLKWCSTKSKNTLTILNPLEEGYTFKEIPLEASTTKELDKGRYILLVNLENSSIQAQIYELDQVGNFKEAGLVFDTGKIIDDNLIKRRKGRFGWWAQFADGDAYLKSIKSRGLNFGEVVSREFQSITPVKGVSLYAGATEDKQLAEVLSPTNEFVTISVDPAASSSGKALKIKATPLKSLQGVITNAFLIDDPKNLSISFDLKFPLLKSPGGGLSIFLLGEYEQIVPLHVTFFENNVWSHVKVSLKNTLIQTGIYQLVFMQTLPVLTTTWWLDKLMVKTSSLKWAARSQGVDAWHLQGNQWQDIGSTINKLNGGLVFNEIGSGLQIRGQAVRQNAVIHEFKAIPQYATLGRFVWNNEFQGVGKLPESLEIEDTINELEVKLTGKASDADGYIAAYYWSFGDDTYGAGPQTTHTYSQGGTYTVTLTVKDNFGNASAKQKTITVT